jgi:hypothetical protein
MLFIAQARPRPGFRPPDRARVRSRRAAAVLAASLLLPATAPALEAPDPSGLYESQCITGPALFPVPCESLPTPPPMRTRSRLFARQYTPPVGDCSLGPCTPAKTVIEGHVRVPRFVSYSGEWNEETQTCEVFADWPRQLVIEDVYDVTGEVVWHNLGKPNFAGGAISLVGNIASDPGPFSHIPSMKFGGSYWWRKPSASLNQSHACVELVGSPTLNMTKTFNAEPVNSGQPRCGGNVGYPVLNCSQRLSGDFFRPLVTLEGKLVSLLPTFTETDNEVHHATIVVYEQRTGMVREQYDDEEEDDYREYLEARGRHEVRRIQIERRRDGSYTFDEPGRFEVPDLPVFGFLSGDASTHWGTVWYTLEIEGAETEEAVPQQGGGTEPHQLVFASGRAINVLPDEETLVIGLDPLDGPGAKLELIDRLSARCANHYATVENGARFFVENAVAGGLTEQESEAIRRGAWAERAILGSADLADQLVETSLTGLGAVLGELWDDVVKFQRADLAAKKKARAKLEAAPKPPATSKFKVDTEPLGNRAVEAMLGGGDRQLLAQIDMAGSVKKAIKGLKPSIVYWLERYGHPDAANAADLIIRGASAMADTFENRTVTGATKSILKLAIKESVQYAKPLILDTSPLSYCGLTDDDLQESVDQMALWNAADDEIYRKDRREVVQVMTELNRSATDVLARMRASQEIAIGCDTVEDAAATIGLVVKWAKVVEKFALVVKYTLNGISVVRPMAETFAVLPGHVEDAVAAAYASASPSSAAVVGPSSRAARTATSPVASTTRVAVSTDSAAFDAVVLDLASALEADDIGEVIRLLVDADESAYVDERAAFEREVEALFLQAGAAAGVHNLEAPLREANEEWLALQVVQAEAADRLQRLVVDVYSGKYADTADAGYLRERHASRTLLHLIRHHLAALGPKLESVSAALASNTFTAVVLVEALAPVSDSTGEPFVSDSPETFTFRVRVTNLGGTPLAGLSLRKVATSPLESLALPGPATVAVGSGTLAPFDGLDGAGGDEAIVEWPVTYDGDFAWELLLLGADLLQDGAEPDAISTAGARRVLAIDASVADADADGLPNDFEAEFGLDPGADDGKDDADDDGLSNLVELELGTSPTDGDSDGDGVGDGDELLPAAGGFVTDPLLADTDGDGTDDGSDGDPLDGGSTAAPPAADEPSVSLSKSLVVLTPDQPIAGVTVTNGGPGTLLWSARNADAALFDVSPPQNELRDEGSTLFVSVREGFDFAGAGVLVSSVEVGDAAGAVKDFRKLTVVAGADASAAVCGHGRESSIGGDLSASDALFALRASVGTADCAPCQCDVDTSGSVAASDALRILRAAVGISSTLACPSC